jgi:hypothetical protein
MPEYLGLGEQLVVEFARDALGPRRRLWAGVRDAAVLRYLEEDEDRDAMVSEPPTYARALLASDTRSGEPLSYRDLPPESEQLPHDLAGVVVSPNVRTVELHSKVADQGRP